MLMPTRSSSSALAAPHINYLLRMEPWNLCENSLPRKDRYNPKKDLYWYEEKITASFASKASSSTTDTTTVEAEVPRDAQGNAVLGQTISWDPSEIGISSGIATGHGISSYVLYH